MWGGSLKEEFIIAPILLISLVTCLKGVDILFKEFVVILVNTESKSSM